MRVRFTIIMLALLLVPMAARGAMTARYITTTGTASYTSCTNILYPTSINAIATSSTAGDHWYVKAGAYARGAVSDTWAKNGAPGSPIIIEGGRDAMRVYLPRDTNKTKALLEKG